MSGNVAEPVNEAEFTKQVKEKFNVDEKTANQIIAFGVCMSLDKMKKWIKSNRKLQKQKAEEMYTLTKKIKMADLTMLGMPRYCKVIYDAVDKLEKIVLEMCIEHE